MKKYVVSALSVRPEPEAVNVDLVVKVAGPISAPTNVPGAPLESFRILTT